MLRKFSYSVLVILLLITITGCDKENEITPKLIGDLIFNDGIYKAVFLQNSQFQDLTNEELMVLKKSIMNGRELTELESNEMPAPDSREYLYIDLIKRNKSGLGIFYNLKEKYLLLRKVQVNEQKVQEYEKKQQTFKKYLSGTYKLYPSSEMERLVKLLGR